MGVVKIPNSDDALSSSSKEGETKKRNKKISSVIGWIVFWPTIMFGIAVVVFFLISNLIYKGQALSGANMRNFWILFLLIIVTICIAFTIISKHAKSIFGRMGAPVLRVYMWIGIIIVVSQFIIPNFSQQSNNTSASMNFNFNQSNSTTVPVLTSDATIVSALKQVGATDTDNIETKFVDSFSDSTIDNQTGDYQSFMDANNKWSYGIMSIKNGIQGNKLLTNVAHEYLHHVWYKDIDSITKEKLTSDLITMYGRDSIMQDRVKSYSDNQVLQPTELFSYYCTEASDSYLTSYVLSQCNQYINRSSLTFSR